MNICALHACYAHSGHKRAAGPSIKRVAGSSKPSAVGNGIEASILFENSVPSSPLSDLSRSLFR